MSGPELLSPAGSLKSLRYAFAYGADAVYAGLPRYSLRVRNNAFDLAELDEGIQIAHRLGKQLYVTTNIMAHNTKVDTFLGDIAPVVALGPDALIMADPGLIMLVRERWPELPVHLSVQANTVNYASVNFWQQMGLSRIILSRELSLDEIAEIRQRCPEMELEVFVHGALCIAYSGRCLLSGYFNRRDPNQGACTNSCRWQYRVMPATADENGDLRPVEGSEFLIEEAERPGEYMPIIEDESGTYIMNSKDLRAVEHVARLVEIGIDSLKIEGRTKSHYYAARTAQVYRQAIAAAEAGRPLEDHLIGALENLANRGYTDGFLQRHHSAEYQNYLQNASDSLRQRFVAELISVDETRGQALLEVKNRFAVGDELEIVLPQGNVTQRLEAMTDEQGRSIEAVAGSGYRVQIPWSHGAVEMALVARNLAS